MPQRDRAFAAPPDPGRAGTLDELVEGLRLLKVWAGDPSYDAIKERVNAAWRAAGRPVSESTSKTTVADCFRLGRRRVNTDLVLAVVAALHGDAGYVAHWRQALRVVAGEALAGSQVAVQDRLPPDLAEFTGRTAEVDRLRTALRHGEVAAIVGMAGVGKTRLAVRAGHELARNGSVDRVLFVDLRGFHPDPAQPPADPAAVLEGFLRLLGVPGQDVPHDLAARTAAYRGRLADTRTLVVLDNAADADQVRPLLPGTRGCAVLVTSRRALTELSPAAHLTVDVFTPDEAVAFLTRTTAETAPGVDPRAAARIADRCGHLPLALGLVTAHIRGAPGWTLTDHADRLDERHHHRRLDTAVELALDLSYQHLPAAGRRLLRLAALHPGQDLDARAACALTDSDLPTAGALLRHLCRDHLLQPHSPGRYTFHDLVRAYATGRATDEDPPPERRAALTRLFDFYLAASAAAVDALYPAEAHGRPRVPQPGTPVPADLDSAKAWLDTERPTLVAVASHTATHGWPTHTARLSTTLFRYLGSGYPTDALTVHGHARHAAHQAGDLTGEAHALTSLGSTHTLVDQHGQATEHFQRALLLFRRTGDRAGEARVLNNLGFLDSRLCRFRQAADHYARALALFRLAGHEPGEAHALNNLGETEGKLGRHREAFDHLQQSLALFQRLGDSTSEAWTLNSFGEVEVRLGRHEQARDHLQQALDLYRRLGNHVGEAWTLNTLGTLDRTSDHFRQALAIFRKTGERNGEASALNNLAEAAHTAGRPIEAITHHTAAHRIAVDIGARDQEAHAHAGLGNAHHTLGDLPRAQEHHRCALALYTDLDLSEADQVSARLAECSRHHEPSEQEAHHGRHRPSATAQRTPAD